MRPFEVGDLVVTFNFGVCVIVNMTHTKKIIAVTRFGIDPKLECHHIGDNMIKHIRKPRKGSKEARDIVAMLGWNIHNSRLALKRYFRGKNLKRTFKEINAHHNETAIKIAIFEKAKSILK